YTIISLKEAIEILKKNLEITNNLIVITFDDGYRDNFENAFPILKNLQIPFTIFLTVNCIQSGKPLWIDYIINAIDRMNDDLLDLRNIGFGIYSLKTPINKADAVEKIVMKGKNLINRNVLIDYILEKANLDYKDKIFKNIMLSWDEVKKMKGENVTFGSHSLNHYILSNLSFKEIELEISESKKILEDKLGCEINFFSYPNGSATDFNEYSKKVLKKYGYDCACSLIRGANYINTDLYALKRIGIYPWKCQNCKGNLSKSFFSFKISNFPIRYNLYNLLRNYQIK
ncbi:MAG: polysaccharide deacetylase family protein, partial [Candidatus Hodarchaeota archaeon]